MRCVRPIHARTGAGAGVDGGPHGGLAKGDLESARASKRTGDVRVDKCVWEKGTSVDETAEEHEEDVGPGVRRGVRSRCRS